MLRLLSFIVCLGPAKPSAAPGETRRTDRLRGHPFPASVTPGRPREAIGRHAALRCSTEPIAGSLCAAAEEQALICEAVSPLHWRRGGKRLPHPQGDGTGKAAEAPRPEALKSHSTPDHLKEYVQSSTQIGPGPPVRYRLTTERTDLDEKEAVKRWIFGQRDTDKENKVILILGETGTGKTTLVNTMVNHILGVKWEDKIWFEITEEGDENLAQSRTTSVIVYEVFVKENPLSLTIIDTPGYGDTEGIEKDDQVTENLIKLFKDEDGVKEIDMVGLMVPASHTRLTDRTCYIFDTVLSLFSREIQNNVVLFVSNSDGLPAKNISDIAKEMGLPCARNKKKEPVHFFFANRQTETFGKKYENIEKTLYECSETNIKSILTFLETVETKDLQMTESVLQKRKQLNDAVKDCSDHIDFIERKHHELREVENAMQIHKKEMEKNKNFTFEVDEPYKAKVPIETTPLQAKEATCCSVCEENCHAEGCWWVRDLSWCSVMKNGYCTVCANKCHYTDHVKENKVYVHRTRKVKMINPEMKQRYEAHEKENGRKLTVRNEIQDDLDKAGKEKTRLAEEAYQCIISLKQMALNAISLSTHQHLDFMIERMEELGRSERVEKLMSLKEEFHKRFSQQQKHKPCSLGESGIIGATAATNKRVIPRFNPLRFLPYRFGSRISLNQTAQKTKLRWPSAGFLL
ncbi:uncharacterized protein LOC115816381 [Chanos chanos]|uniref:Uncharacterized protein LOC115816381 n=1 Tax=Chanos chanos TaxID=29144 RepID=A0A6J2VTD8_CHACN|nr:uncharacterized protein LOC115816381 [Chanos chanos]